MARSIHAISNTIRHALNFRRPLGGVADPYANENDLHVRLKRVVVERRHSEDPDDLTDLIEQIWEDLDGQVPQARIRQIATGVAAKFHGATVTTHIPLFIRHLTREWLKEEIKQQDLNA